MAAGKWKVYDFAKLYIGSAVFDLEDGTNWKAALFTSASNCNTLSVGTGVYGDLTDEVANGNGYATGGVDVVSITWTRSGGTITFDADAFGWTASGSGITARYCVIYKNTTVSGVVKPLLCVCLLDTAPADVTVTAGNTLTITPAATGFFTLSGATTD